MSFIIIKIAITVQWEMDGRNEPEGVWRGPGEGRVLSAVAASGEGLGIRVVGFDWQGMSVT